MPSISNSNRLGPQRRCQSNVREGMVVWFDCLLGIEISGVWNHSLELVSLTFASWNQLLQWLRRLDAVRRTA
jgi:hypothetical protein